MCLFHVVLGTVDMEDTDHTGIMMGTEQPAISTEDLQLQLINLLMIAILIILNRPKIAVQDNVS